MDDTIKAMIEALDKYNAGYVKVDIGEYSIIVATKGTGELIDELLDEEE